MKAAFIRKVGGPEVIEWGEMPAPKSAEDEALVKVSAVAVNPVDTYIRSGKYKLPGNNTFPFIIGFDLIGVVDKVGSKVKNFKPGDRVWTHSAGSHSRQGCFAEYVAISETYLYPAPKKVDDVDIVSVLMAGATACVGLINVAKLKASDIIFVNGGAGTVGSTVIQLAKARGARVFTATSGGDKTAWCKSIGADLVLDYGKNDLIEKVKKAAPDGVQVFWDTSRNPNFDIAVAMLSKKGRIVLMAGSDARPPFPVGPFYHKECIMEGFTTNAASAETLSQCAEVFNVCLEQKQLKSKIAKIFPLKEAAKAHQMMENDHDLWGKIVLTV
jgi:NADPH:quinone reductase